MLSEVNIGSFDLKIGFLENLEAEESSMKRIFWDVLLFFSVRNSLEFLMNEKNPSDELRLSQFISSA